MGIKNIHIVLITASVVLSLIFGLWALTHDYVFLGGCSLVAVVGFAIYGIQFIKKTRGL
ncbi:MAG: hypothetical protein HY209_06765 [Candidatus Omnitrophica bacterium]|nr:hypothetical protein [Candidatus Omnitrophota bacterium]